MIQHQTQISIANMTSAIIAAGILLLTPVHMLYAADYKLRNGKVYSGARVGENENYFTIDVDGTQIRLAKSLVAEIDGVAFKQQPQQAAAPIPAPLAPPAQVQQVPTVPAQTATSAIPSVVTTPASGIKSFRLQTGAMFRGTVVTEREDAFIIDISGSQIKIVKSMIAEIDNVKYIAASPPPSAATTQIAPSQASPPTVSQQSTSTPVSVTAQTPLPATPAMQPPEQKPPLSVPAPQPSPVTMPPPPAPPPAASSPDTAQTQSSQAPTDSQPAQLPEKKTIDRPASSKPVLNTHQSANLSAVTPIKPTQKAIEAILLGESTPSSNPAPKKESVPAAKRSSNSWESVSTWSELVPSSPQTAKKQTLTSFPKTTAPPSSKAIDSVKTPNEMTLPETTIVLSQNDLKKRIGELHSLNPQTRMAGIIALSSAREQAAPAVAQLVKMIGDTTVFMPAPTGGQDILFGIFGQTTISEAASRALVRIGKPSIKPAADALTQNSWIVRKQAAFILGELKAAEAVKALLPCLKDTNIYVQGNALEALVKIGDAASLIETLKGKDPDIKKAAIEALSKMKGSQAVEPLIRVLDDKDSYVREKAASALGEIKDPRAVDGLVSVLTDNISFVRLNAVEALGKIGDTRVLGRLAEMQKDESDLVRQKVGTTLKLLTKIEFGKYDNNLESLIEAIRHPEAAIRERAANTLWLLTEQKFGIDYNKWHSWWLANKETAKNIK